MSFSRWGICFGTLATLLGCREVLVEPAEGGGGGTTSSSAGDGGAGGGPATTTHERLVKIGRLTEDRTGLQAWDDPDETGIARDADVEVEMDGPLSVAVLADRLFVLSMRDGGQSLEVFEDVWAFDASARPAATIPLSVDPPGDLRVIPELALLYGPGFVIPNADGPLGGLEVFDTNWRWLAYDSGSDRLFVGAQDEVDWVESASASPAPWAPSFRLFDGASQAGACDGARLYVDAAFPGVDDISWRGTKIGVWLDPAALGPDIPQSYLLRTNEPFQLGLPHENAYAFAPLAAGLIIGTEANVVTWSGDEAVSSSGAVSASFETGVTTDHIAVSRNGQVYVSGPEQVVRRFADTGLSAVLDATSSTSFGFALAER
jgi:hypothetical protein